MAALSTALGQSLMMAMMARRRLEERGIQPDPMSILAEMMMPEQQQAKAPDYDRVSAIVEVPEIDPATGQLVPQTRVVSGYVTRGTTYDQAMAELNAQVQRAFPGSRVMDFVFADTQAERALLAPYLPEQSRRQEWEVFIATKDDQGQERLVTRQSIVDWAGRSDQDIAEAFRFQYPNATIYVAPKGSGEATDLERRFGLTAPSEPRQTQPRWFEFRRPDGTTQYVQIYVDPTKTEDQIIQELARTDYYRRQYGEPVRMVAPEQVPTEVGWYVPTDVTDVQQAIAQARWASGAQLGPGWRLASPVEQQAIVRQRMVQAGLAQPDRVAYRTDQEGRIASVRFILPGEQADPTWYTAPVESAPTIISRFLQDLREAHGVKAWVRRDAKGTIVEWARSRTSPGEGWEEAPPSLLDQLDITRYRQVAEKAEQQQQYGLYRPPDRGFEAAEWITKQEAEQRGWVPLAPHEQRAFEQRWTAQQLPQPDRIAYRTEPGVGVVAYRLLTPDEEVPAGWDVAPIGQADEVIDQYLAQTSRRPERFAWVLVDANERIVGYPVVSEEEPPPDPRGRWVRWPESTATSIINQFLGRQIAEDREARQPHIYFRADGSWQIASSRDEVPKDAAGAYPIDNELAAQLAAGRLQTPLAIRFRPDGTLEFTTEAGRSPAEGWHYVATFDEALEAFRAAAQARTAREEQAPSWLLLYTQDGRPISMMPIPPGQDAEELARTIQERDRIIAVPARTAAEVNTFIDNVAQYNRDLLNQPLTLDRAAQAMGIPLEVVNRLPERARQIRYANLQDAAEDLLRFYGWSLWPLDRVPAQVASAFLASVQTKAAPSTIQTMLILQAGTEAPDMASAMTTLSAAQVREMFPYEAAKGRIGYDTTNPRDEAAADVTVMATDWPANANRLDPSQSKTIERLAQRFGFRAGDVISPLDLARRIQPTRVDDIVALLTEYGPSGKPYFRRTGDGRYVYVGPEEYADAGKSVAAILSDARRRPDVAAAILAVLHDPNVMALLARGASPNAWIFRGKDVLLKVSARDLDITLSGVKDEDRWRTAFFVYGALAGMYQQIADELRGQIR